LQSMQMLIQTVACDERLVDTLFYDADYSRYGIAIRLQGIHLSW